MSGVGEGRRVAHKPPSAKLCRSALNGGLRLTPGRPAELRDDQSGGALNARPWCQATVMVNGLKPATPQAMVSPLTTAATPSGVPL